MNNDFKRLTSNEIDVGPLIKKLSFKSAFNNNFSTDQSLFVIMKLTSNTSVKETIDLLLTATSNGAATT